MKSETQLNVQKVLLPHGKTCNWFGNKPSWASRVEEKWTQKTTPHVQETRGCFSSWWCPGSEGQQLSTGASKRAGHWWPCKTLPSEVYHYFGINSRKKCSSCCCLCWDTKSSNAVCVHVDGEVVWTQYTPLYFRDLDCLIHPEDTYAYGNFYHILICNINSAI